ncbi:uncharacterized protein EV420DRAFT_694044 [Desarmillaria tabescens]|uniref:DUF952-domain-containing protein n=1 Tax=Armillaria tabescens TaxID=1929756 RepID=A0AA39K4P7_ARMTA|nr:uncharacterized protein EV420DRAFT_694044 [Desarmillaria tabescens]KAK0452143.1 hypothetical protein EV420DRAFT_694044 [Desarmillaria tabescens]
MTDIPIPRLVYKIIPDAPPSPLPHSLPLSALDAKDGFIHLSDASQVPKTADLFFSEYHKVWLLQLDTEVVRKEGGYFLWAENLPGCVHLYGKEKATWDGARLGEGTIRDSRVFTKLEAETWADSMKESGLGWLLDQCTTKLFCRVFGRLIIDS